MAGLFSRCAGLDVHKRTVVACVLVRSGQERTQKVQTLGTTTAELLALQTWRTEHQVTHVAMESTASYGKPVVRHEAPRDREEMQGLLQWAVAAAR